MNRIWIALTLLILSLPCWSANRYARAAGGNWSAAGTWASTSGGTDSVAVPTSSDDVFLDSASGNVTIDANASCKTLNCTGYTNTLRHNGFTLTVAGNITLVAGMTYTIGSNSSQFTISATSTLTTGGKAIRRILLGGNSTVTLGDNLTFAANTLLIDDLQLGNACSIDLNGKTISGASVTDRVLITSNTVGSARTITVNSGTFANADFRDITFSNGGNDLDLSGITGGSGDCGGNSITGGGTVLTFTAPVDQHWTSGVTGNWSNVARWTSRVPLPQDNVFFDVAFSANQTVTADMPRLGKTIDWTGATGTPKFEISLSATCYGGLTLISGMRGSSLYALIFEGRGNFNITNATQTLAGNYTFSGVGSIYTFMDSCTLAGDLTLNNGTLDFNGFNYTGAAIISGGTATRRLNMENSTVTIFGTGDAFNMYTVGNLTLDYLNSTVIMSNVSTAAKNFAGGGKQYNNLSIIGGGTGTIGFTSSNTFNNITVGNPKTLKLTSGTTQTVNSFTANGTSANPITIQSSSAGSPATLSDCCGMNNLYYCSIKDITATGGAVWNAYTINGNVNTSGNSGWSWGPTFDALMMIMD